MNENEVARLESLEVCESLIGTMRYFEECVKTLDNDRSTSRELCRLCSEALDAYRGVEFYVNCENHDSKQDDAIKDWMRKHAHEKMSIAARYSIAMGGTEALVLCIKDAASRLMAVGSLIEGNADEALCDNCDTLESYAVKAYKIDALVSEMWRALGPLQSERLVTMIDRATERFFEGDGV